MKWNRVLLKLSGEALAGPKKTGFDEDTVKEVARQVKISVDAGVEVGIVIGGGNFWRGRTSNAIDRTKADQIGMLATIMNCIYVSEIFRNAGMQTEILTPFAVGAMTRLFSKDLANQYFKEGKVVFFAGGTGHPYFSTDTSIQEVIDKQLAVVDLTASIMCMEHKMPMAVFDLNEKDSIANAMQGKINGTIVTV